jgi:hypothetical protein
MSSAVEGGHGRSRTEEVSWGHGGSRRRGIVFEICRGLRRNYSHEGFIVLALLVS